MVNFPDINFRWLRETGVADKRKEKSSLAPGKEAGVKERGAMRQSLTTVDYFERFVSSGC
jgi:hypothetical protein